MAKYNIKSTIKAMISTLLSVLLFSANEISGARLPILRRLLNDVNVSCSLDVVSIEHGAFKEGTYFGFDVEELDAILERSDWSHERFNVNGRQIVVWANGYGRYEPRDAAKKGDWSVGDTIEFSSRYCPQSDEEEDDCSIEVRSVDHEFGPSVVGKYFNFDKDELDTILGRSDWSNERLDTDKGTVVVWRNPNGGSVGDAHGRFDKSAKAYDWSVGDEITFLDCSTNEIEPEPESKAKQGEICKDGGIVNGG